MKEYRLSKGNKIIIKNVNYNPEEEYFQLVDGLVAEDFPSRELFLIDVSGELTLETVRFLFKNYLKEKRYRIYDSIDNKVDEVKELFEQFKKATEAEEALLIKVEIDKQLKEIEKKKEEMSVLTSVIGVLSRSIERNNGLNKIDE